MLHAFADERGSALVLAGGSEQPVLHREHAEPQEGVLVGLSPKFCAHPEPTLSVDIAAKRDVSRLAQRLVISELECSAFLIGVAGAWQQEAGLSLFPGRRYPNIREHKSR